MSHSPQPSAHRTFEALSNPSRPVSLEVGIMIILESAMKLEGKSSNGKCKKLILFWCFIPGGTMPQIMINRLEFNNFDKFYRFPSQNTADVRLPLANV